MVAPSLQVLAIQVEQVRRQVRALEEHAREVFEAGSFDREAAIGECLAIDLLLGSLRAGFVNASKAPHERASVLNALQADARGALTDEDRKQAEEAANRG